MWQTGLDFSQSNLNTVNYIESVTALAHDHNAGDSFPVPVEIGNTPPKVWTDHDGAHVVDAYGCSVDGSENGFLEILAGPQVPPATYHVFGAAELQQSGTRLTVAMPYGVGHPRNRDSV